MNFCCHDISESGLSSSGLSWWIKLSWLSMWLVLCIALLSRDVHQLWSHVSKLWCIKLLLSGLLFCLSCYPDDSPYSGSGWQDWRLYMYHYLPLLTHANCSRRGRVSTGVCLSVCLSVCLYVFQHDIWKTDAASITKLDIEMFHHESWKPIYFGTKTSKFMRGGGGRPGTVGGRYPGCFS